MKKGKRDRLGHSAFRLGASERITILYEDRDYLVIDKPTGWLVTSPKWSRTRRNLQRELEKALQRRASWIRERNIRYLRFVHRLDRDTSGLLVLAKHPRALQQLSRLFEQQRVRKLYLCHVEGSPSIDAWISSAPIAGVPGREDRVMVDPRGQPAITIFYRLAQAKADALILAAPQTGRTHQIRIHLKAAGHPIVGDPLYGASHRELPLDQSKRSPEPFRPRMGLRAWALCFRHPLSKASIEIEAGLPAFMRHFPRPDPPLSLAGALQVIETLTQSKQTLHTRSGRLSKGQAPC